MQPFSSATEFQSWLRRVDSWTHESLGLFFHAWSELIPKGQTESAAA